MDDVNNNVLLVMLVSYLDRICNDADYDLQSLYDSVSIRRADPVDHLEIIMANTRKATVKKISSDIWGILANFR